ncbi:MAG: PASTA domain-containing protein [Bacteroidetes bacterium]|nr:PASTA domain-containing protein [Bacteroidota bacterium]
MSVHKNENTLFKKYFNKTLGYNLLAALAIVIVLLLIVQSGLKTYTRHGESITVPDLRGKNFEQVKKILNDNNLEWLVMDSVYDMSKPPMSIVDQNPKPNAHVKQGRTIYITLNATTAPSTEIPDLIGKSSLKYATMQLQSYGLTVGEPIYKPDPHLNAVIGMLVNGRNVTKKMKVPKGTLVTLVLGDGLGNSRVSVPYVIGLRYEEAEFKLKGYSLNVGAIIADEGVIDTLGAIVYKQIPDYGNGHSMHLGEPIDLFLSKELPAGITIDASLYDKMDSIPTQ